MLADDSVVVEAALLAGRFDFPAVRSDLLDAGDELVQVVDNSAGAVDSAAEAVDNAPGAVDLLDHGSDSLAVRFVLVGPVETIVVDDGSLVVD